MKKPENKVALVYGDGTVGGTISKAFAQKGGRVFLTGRTLEKYKAVGMMVR